MAKAFAKSFYDSAAWRSARDSYISERISIDGGVCERCHSEQGYIVHHKIWLNEHNISDPNVTLNPKNFEYLCKKCHDIEHFEQLNGHKKPNLQCFFDASGQPMPPFGADGHAKNLPVGDIFYNAAHARAKGGL